jgi:large subunit ribosomal protein L3
MGADRITTHNLRVVSVDLENHLVSLRGAVPGAPDGIVIIRKAVAAKRIAAPQPEKKKGKK